MEFDPTINLGHILSILSFIVSVGVGVVLLRARLIVVEGSLRSVKEAMKGYELARIEREKALQIRLNRADDKLETKEDK